MIVQAMCKNCGHGELSHKTIGNVSLCDALAYPNKCECNKFEIGIIMKETSVPCKNCGMKHPIGMVSGIKKNIAVEPPCMRYEPAKEVKV